MRYLYGLILLCGLGSVFGTMNLFAHGDLHERIQEVTKQIELFPRNWDLRQKRGELYLQHEEYRKSWQDLIICYRRQISDDRLLYCLAKAGYFLEKYDRSLHLLQKILNSNPDDIKSWRLKARCHQKKGEFLESSLYLDLVIEKSIRPKPENFIESAEAWLLSAEYMTAQQRIEQGIERLGPLPQLEEMLLSVHLEQRNHKPVLKILSRQIENSHRKEFAYHKRAEAYLEIGERGKCQEDLLSAREAIANLPPHLQRSQAVIDLANSINQYLQKLSLHKI